jgi:hypothetical protein
MDLLRREQREIVSQVESRLRAEHGIGAGAGAVGLELSVLQNLSQQIEVLNHRGEKLTTKGTKDTKRNLTGRRITTFGDLSLILIGHSVQWRSNGFPNRFFAKWALLLIIKPSKKFHDFTFVDWVCNTSRFTLATLFCPPVSVQRSLRRSFSTVGAVSL